MQFQEWLQTFIALNVFGQGRFHFYVQLNTNQFMG